MLRRSVPVLATAVRCEPAPRARRGSVLLRLSWPASCASGLRYPDEFLTGELFLRVCVYYCRTFYKAVRVGEEESGGHVL